MVLLGILSRDFQRISAEMPPPQGGVPDALPWAVDAIPKVVFDPKLMDAVVDIGSVVSIPYDPTNAGVHCLRAVIAPKGKVSHVQGQHGCLVVDGEWWIQSTLVIVHYNPATKRLPGLLLTFIDHGMADNSQEGISISALRLPLLIRKNVYQDMVMVVTIDDVVGFTPILPTVVPWSLHLAPALKQIVMFKTLNIYQPSHIGEFCRRPLGSRLPELKEMSMAELALDTAAVQRQDPAVASRVHASRMAKLNCVFVAIEMRSTAYSLPLEKRVFKLGDFPAECLSPIRAVFAKDTPVRLLRSRLMPSSLEPVEAANILSNLNVPEPPMPAGTSTAEVSSGLDRSDFTLADEDDEDDSEPSSESDSNSVVEVPPTGDISVKRKRLAPNRFTGVSSKKQMIASKKAARVAEKVQSVKSVKKSRGGGAPSQLRSAGLNRYGQPFTRGGPYNKGGSAGTGLRTAVPLKEKPVAVAVADSTSPTLAALQLAHSAMTLKLANVEMQLAQMTLKHAALTQQIEVQREHTQLQIKAAVLESQVRSSNKMIQQFAAGVAMGQGMSSKSNVHVPAVQCMTPYVGSSSSVLQQPHFGSAETETLD